MLTLFTYADIQAVHPDALTPWKAENLWRLSMQCEPTRWTAVWMKSG